MDQRYYSQGHLYLARQQCSTQTRRRGWQTAASTDLADSVALQDLLREGLGDLPPKLSAVCMRHLEGCLTMTLPAPKDAVPAMHACVVRVGSPCCEHGARAGVAAGLALLTDTLHAAASTPASGSAPASRVGRPARH